MPPKNDVAAKPSRSSLFSAKTEYACVSLMELASHHGDPNPLRLKTIADKHDISHRFLVQILLQLKAAGLVESTRGAAGGYHLARPPEQITIADVVQVIDPADPIRGGGETGGGSAMIRTVHSLWADVQAAQKKMLEQTTLADMVTRSQGEYDLMYQI